MDKLSLAISVVALGGAGYLGYTASELSRELKVQTDAATSLEARLAILEHEATKPAAVPAPPPASIESASAASPGGAAPAPVLTGSARNPTLADLDRRLTKFEKLAVDATTWAPPVPAVGQTAESDEERIGESLPSTYYLGSIDAAQTHLALTQGQTAEFERIVGDAKKEIDELHKLPDADGKTWEQIQKDGVTVNGGMISYDGSKLQAFREKTIPGRSESYGAADRRIAEAAKKSLRGGLSSDQQTKFDKAHVDSLLGTGDSGAFSMMTIVGDGGFSFGTLLPAPAPPPIPVLPPLK